MGEEIRLNSSKLGTKEYWNEFYKKEITNFHENDEDFGECWFDDSDAEYKIILNLADSIENGDYQFKHDTIEILDLGTGNGHLLYAMNEELMDRDIDFKFKFTGIDYSPDSIAFCKEIGHQKYPNGSFEFEQVDLLLKDHKFLNNKFDIILDKGTLDAIALNQDPLPEFGNKIGMDVYSSQVKQMMNQNSILLITSCNFTEDELIKIITENGTNELTVHEKIDYPSFQFNGVKGSTICSVSFIKN